MCLTFNVCCVNLIILKPELQITSSYASNSPTQIVHFTLSYLLNECYPQEAWLSKHSVVTTGRTFIQPLEIACPFCSLPPSPPAFLTSLSGLNFWDGLPWPIPWPFPHLPCFALHLPGTALIPHSARLDMLLDTEGSPPAARRGSTVPRSPALPGRQCCLLAPHFPTRALSSQFFANVFKPQISKLSSPLGWWGQHVCHLFPVVPDNIVGTG